MWDVWNEVLEKELAQEDNVLKDDEKAKAGSNNLIVKLPTRAVWLTEAKITEERTANHIHTLNSCQQRGRERGREREVERERAHRKENALMFTTLPKKH